MKSDDKKLKQTSLLDLGVAETALDHCIELMNMYYLREKDILNQELIYSINHHIQRARDKIKKVQDEQKPKDT